MLIDRGVHSTRAGSDSGEEGIDALLDERPLDLARALQLAST